MLTGRRAIGAAAVVAAAMLLAGCSSPTSAPTTATPLPGATRSSTADPYWSTYHADSARDGAVPGRLPHAATAWTADLGSAVYGQPVTADGITVAGTETDQVVAMDASTGTRRWTATIGTPLRNVAAVAGCGNIDPLGITSTPVIDRATSRVYVVGEVTHGHAVQHRLAGFDLRTGHRVLDTAIDPPLPAGEHPAQLLQRPGLALANGRIYAAYGGNSGDCGQYHGWVVGASLHGGAPVSFEAAADGEGGAIWMSGGAPAIDSAGNLFVSTGNANPDPPQGGPDPKRYTESIVKLSPDLRPLASFKDRTAGGDEDLSTTDPVLLPGGLVLTVGKTDTAYLLRASDLHRVAALGGVCGSDPDGGAAYDIATGRLFLPCRGGGLQEIDVPGRRLGPRISGANSSPILIGGTLWAADYDAGTLSAFDPIRGSRTQTIPVGSLPHFAAPSSAGGLLYLGTTRGVAAFRSDH